MAKAMHAELHYQHRALTETHVGIGNQIEHNLVVSLTSFSQRIDSAYLVIETLFNQTLRADRIVLWLAEEEFPRREADLPLALVSQCTRGLEIRYTRDLGPYKKIIPALAAYPGSLIVTVDDDILYPVDMLEKLYRSYLANPNAIHSNRVHQMKFAGQRKLAPYRTWNRPTQQDLCDLTIFPTGVAGVLYFPGCFHEDVSDETLFMNLSPAADDIWLKAMSLMQNVKCQSTVDYRDWQTQFLPIQGSNARALKTLNKAAVGGNDDKLQAVFDYYDCWGLFSNNRL